MPKAPAKKPAKKPANRASKPVMPANKDREEAKVILREIMKFGEDEQARVLAAIGLAQLSHTPIH